MSCKYFILTKPTKKNIQDNTENQIVKFNTADQYILPETLIECYVRNGLFESSLIEWCKQFCNKEKTFLDIGAHTGTYSIPLSQYSKDVYSFEPQKMTYYALCGSVALSNIKNITCLNFGLGSEEQIGEKQLYIVSNDGGGSTVHNTNNALGTEKITIKTLDELNIDNVGFIKMDIEENEYYALLGSKETLKRSNYPKILFESNDKDVRIFKFLENLNYKIVSVYGYNNMFLATFY